MNRNLPNLSEFLPKHEERVYPVVGKCIYCGRNEALSDEHIIPFSLGGNFILPKSSCAECAKVTSSFEQTCMRTMYGPLRLLYNLPTRRRKKRPEKLPLKVKFSADQPDWELVDVKQEEYPFLITFPYFDAPGILAGRPLGESEGPTTKRLWIRGGCPFASFDELLPALARKLNAHSLFPESKADVPSFSRLLAKIALSFAVAEIGTQAFADDLTSIILGKDLHHCRYYIGSASQDEPPRNMLHELAILKFSSNVVVVRIRLLCKLGTPTYFVAVSNN
jgi:hypothetical protein